MRGAQPDAVCPRCDHHQPPSDSPLAHCKQCGLTFQPKEIFVSTKRPTRTDDEEPVFDAALVVTPPKSLTLIETDEEITYSWTNDPNVFRIGAPLLVAIGVALWLANEAMNDKIGYTVILALLGIGAFFQARPSVKLRLAKRYLRSGRGMLLLSEMAGVELDGKRLFARMIGGKRSLIVDVDDPMVGAYLCNMLTKRFAALEQSRLLEPPHPRDK